MLLPVKTRMWSACAAVCSESKQCYIPRFSLNAFLVMERNIFKCLLSMGMAAILFSGAEQFKQTVNNPSTECLNLNLIIIGEAISKKTTFRDYRLLYI